MGNKVYAAIDLKSFYASVECFHRGLDPLTTNLVVADASRTEKTICLAVSPSLKQYGIPGRARLFEVIQKLKEVNRARLKQVPGYKFKGKSFDDNLLKKNKSLEVDFVIATPRMAKYIEVSSKIYSIYLRYVSPEDIHVYSIDEVFIDLTPYLNTYKMTPHEMTMRMIQEVLKETGITATGGIGTNMYLAKVAMDIVAKHIPADKDGVRIAELDEMKYRELLWNHRPLTSFWRVGQGIARKLEENGMFTMGDVARKSLEDEYLLYKLFGINAELLIDHAWGVEPVEIKDIKGYKSDANSLGTGQVLSCGYDFKKGRIVAREMADSLALDLVAKGLVCDSVSFAVNYDKESLSDGSEYAGPLEMDRYGKVVPKMSHGTIRFRKHTSSSKEIVEAVLAIYDKVVNKALLIRRLNIAAGNTLPLEKAPKVVYEQVSLFSSFKDDREEEEKAKMEKKEENDLQKTILAIQGKYGKNALLKGSDLSEGATQIERNNQIGGHKK